jgi:hypothetical protein
MSTLVVNLYGGPGVGKSTIAAGTFFRLKQAGINAELVTEFAKDKVWEESYRTLDNQIYIFGKQYHRIYRLLNKVEVVITDSPILLSLCYNRENMLPSFRQLVFEIYRSLNTLDIFLVRQTPYNPIGRMQTEEEAKEIDRYLHNLLSGYNIKHKNIYVNKDALKKIETLVYDIIKS